ncbi:virulence factor family protein [Methylomonas sp. HW2-6]|uniref:virulence factor family protein n=1 Tax=Methylomonas sp. HW2-6 TaxID=3376687 RepID=UPI0040419CFE
MNSSSPTPKSRSWIKRKVLWLSLLLSILVAVAIWFSPDVKPPVVNQQLANENLGEVTVAKPLWGSQGAALVVIESQNFPAKALAQRLASLGVTAAIIDDGHLFKGLHAANQHCLDSQSVATSLNALLKQLRIPSASRVVVAGIGQGALIPFLNAQTPANPQAHNLSIGFSVELPADLTLCPPFVGTLQTQRQQLVSAPTPKAPWRSVWTDQPADDTAVFIRTLGHVDTRIAAYDTPVDELLIEEIKAVVGANNQIAPPMPVVEVPASKPGDSVTLFYSGDGGWRDLDRTVAGEMAAQNYPVVGVDVLRYFWTHKTPEQAATDLAATMTYYRKHWNVKSFVLAGYSFGADILPPIYNRLQKADQDDVKLLVLLALAKEADFEIHVSGWLGQSGGEHMLAPELVQMPKNKILCIYGKEEKADTACTTLANSDATILELPGGHHFDQDYPKLTRQILDVYRQHGIQ